jgi:plasmid stability protein
MHQLTIRGFDDRLQRRIRETARADGTSLNRAALKLLRRGAGLEEGGDPSRAIGDALDDLIGTWTDEEAHELEEAIKDFELIDDDVWR